VLGRLALEADSEPIEGAAGRPRSLALLAILAGGGDSGVPRDRLLLYLWPESNNQRARNSLHQALHTTRRHLGDGVVQAEALTVRLNPSVFSSDLRDFQAALDRGDVEQAVELYQGAFLEGFSLPELPEFSRWIEEERRRIARLYSDALEAAAARASRHGRHREAIERWQALARIDPLSSRPILGLMRAFVDAGNSAAALAHARDYETRVGQELGTAPDQSVAALAAELRQPPAARENDAVARSPADAASAPPRRAVPTRIWKAAVIGLALMDLMALTALWLTRRPPPQQPADPDLVAVFPFTVEGGPESQYLASGMVDLLTSNLEGAGGIRGVDPQVLLESVAKRESPLRTPAQAREAAARLGAGRAVLGRVVERGGRLHLRAAVFDHDSGDRPMALATVEGESKDLFDLVDRLTAELLAEGPDARDRLARVAATTTDSLDALKRYLTGERELRAGRYVTAQEAFRRAVELDPAFALAYYRLSIASEWAGQDSLARLAADSAAHLAGRLSDHDRLLVQALAARRAGAWADAERLYRQVVDNYPDDVEAHLQLGQLLFQTNPLRGRSAAESRPAFERVLALDSENEEALVHLARIASIEGRREAMDTLMRRLLALGSEVEVLETRAFRAFALGDREAWKRVTRELMDNPPDVPAVTALQVATYLDDVDGAESFAHLLTGSRYSDDVRGMAHRLLARVAVARGRWRAARAQLDSAGRFDPVAELELRSLLAVLPFLQVSRAERLEIRHRVDGWQARLEGPGDASHSAGHTGLHPAMRLYRLGLLDASLGDTTAALRFADSLQVAGDSASGLRADALRTFARSIRARVAGEAGRPAEALEQLELSRWDVVESIFEAEALDRYYRAELLFALGRQAEALEWYRTIAERATYELVYVAPARWRQAWLYAKAGDRGRAADAYRTVARLWGDADPPLRKTAAEAARRARAFD
jgi:DNA-binding SARP family transcriptional activator/TolB-like protein/Tfp pilus assembly protein PilF